MSRQQDDYGGPVGGQSGAVTAVAIVNFILGGLTVALGIAIIVGGAAITSWLTGAAGSVEPPPGMTPEQIAQFKQVQQVAGTGGGFLTMIFGILGFCFLLFGLPQIIAGLGVLKRRQWGRILTLILAVLAAIFGVLNVMGGNIIGFGINIAYAVFCFVVLLNSKNAAEFRSSP